MQQFARSRLLSMPLIAILLMTLLFSAAVPSHAAGPQLANPILFVTHVPTINDAQTAVTIFNNHTGDLYAAGRGGDLWLRLADGTLRNLTQRAGLGSTGSFQDDKGIAVRDPAISWDAKKALFSMVVGAPLQATSTPPTYFWQIYEITNLDQVIQVDATPNIVKVANQPNYNNITPVYGTNGRIIFTSDRPRDGSAYLYPLLDEYNMFPTVSGLWSLDPASGDLFLMDHSPSGDLTPSIDSYGRVIFVRWDHMERDQQADIDALNAQKTPPQNCIFCTFNYSDESANASKQANTEIFPEPRPQRTDLLANTNIAGHHMNEFLPWQIDEDGTNPETINHIGRHELLFHILAAFTNDSNLQTLSNAPNGAFNQNRISKFLQIKEDPAHPGTFYGIDALERTHASGQIIKLTGGSPGNDADHMAISYITHRETFSTTLQVSLPNSDGHYRDPLPMSDGSLIASYDSYKNFDVIIGNNTQSKFDFRLYTMGTDPNNASYMAHNQLLTNTLPAKTVSYYEKNNLINFSGQLWEIQPVEVRARTIPNTTPNVLGNPEQLAFNQAGVTPAELQAFLTQHGLALIVSRNVTTRDHSDIQQPFRLQIGLNGAMTAPGTGTLYHITDFQLFQADQLRGMNGSAQVPTPPGRRVIAQPLHDPTALAYNPPNANGPTGSVVLGDDGSMAAFVPARRAVTWQMTDSNGTPVVRERVWLTAQPGEIRVCASCHGINQTSQAGGTVPTNTPQALIQLLQYWKQQNALTPTLTNLSPSSATAGAAAFTIAVTGTNFASDAQVEWNGTALSTTFSDSSHLTAQVTAAKIANFGSANITVLNVGTSLSSNSLSFTINNPAKQNQTISFGAIGNHTLGDSAFNISATASSGLLVSFTVTGSCSISGTTITLVAVGTCSITAHQAGNAGFNPSPDFVRSFSIQAVTTTKSKAYLPLVQR